MPDWIAIAIYRDTFPGIPPGRVKIIATENGTHAKGARRIEFLFPAAQYDRSPLPFVVPDDIVEEHIHGN